MGEGYAQNDEHLREMERQAYEEGNLCFRDWEDSVKGTIYNESLQKGAKKKMSFKKWTPLCRIRNGFRSHPVATTFPCRDSSLQHSTNLGTNRCGRDRVEQN
jgi:hypothetical protein